MRGTDFVKRRHWRNALAGLCLMLAACAFVGGRVGARSDAILAYEGEFSVIAPEARGQLRFLFDDMGGLSTDTLETSALPWKLVAAALLLEHSDATGALLDRSELPVLLRRFGFVTPDQVDNWLAPVPQPKFRLPVGIVKGEIEGVLPRIKLEVANLGCAACHGGVTYDQYGNPQNSVWAGLPNTSLNLEAYTAAVYGALKATISEPDRLVTAVATIYPETTPDELVTLRDVIQPRISKRLDQLSRSIDRPLPFHNGAGGLTNGIASLKFQLGLLPADELAHEFGFVSVPDIGATRWRSSLLVDGLYALPGSARFDSVHRSDDISGRVLRFAPIVSFFTVPALAVSPRQAYGLFSRTREILSFAAIYSPPKFPGEINRTKAEAGRGVYETHCAACHGTYSSDTDRPELLTFPNRLVPQSEIGTDPTRWEAADAALISAISQTDFGEAISARQTGGYVAPVLGGLWATAPYLHNGSIPTLWHLMHPEVRPVAFSVGGHRLDFVRVGIAGTVGGDGVMTYPMDYRPWAEPAIYDTRQPGRANSGHEYPFELLSEPEKQALLEFLKLL
jgi:RoxA-like, cytochrome c-like